MALNARDVTLVRESFEALRPRMEDASAAFYERLFSLAPEIEEMFRADIENQGMRFMTAVGTILRQIDEEGEARGVLEGLGRGHAALGVRSEHYQPMRTALIETFGEVLGGRFTAEHARAWGSAYDHIAAEMMAAGRK